MKAISNGFRTFTLAGVDDTLHKMLSDSTPRSLAALHARKRRTSREDLDDLQSSSSDSGSASPISGQQMGLMFQTAQAVEEIAGQRPAAKKRERRVWSVRELVSGLRKHVEDEYADAWVEGEVSNCRSAPSGHIYFTLKDEDAQLPVVMFRREAAALKFKPCDGHAVLVRGAVSVYENRGQLQIIAKAIEPRGEGALRLQFEQLKERLLAEGLFNQERKRPLPPYPLRAGIITSPSGAVIRDIVHVVQRRHPALHLLVFPARMQGNEASLEARAGIAFFNSEQSPPVDLIVIARGGGSAEDLSCFNDEALARSIAASALPVVSAIGHETDFTIADFVADLRAPTPSAAAEIITAHWVGAHESAGNLQRRLDRAMRFQLLQARQRFGRIHVGAMTMRLRESLRRREQHVDVLQMRLESAMHQTIADYRARIERCDRSLQSTNIPQLVRLNLASLDAMTARLTRAFERRVEGGSRELLALEARLRSLNPAAVLQRGFALVFDEAGNLVRNASHLQVGDSFTARFGDGAVRSRVVSKDTE